MQWNRVVTIEIQGRPSQVRRICSTKEAAMCLLRDWPRKSGPLYARAVRACAEALKGQSDDAGARHSFVDAARAASMRVQVSLGPSVLSSFDYELAEICDRFVFEHLSAMSATRSETKRHGMP